MIRLSDYAQILKEELAEKKTIGSKKAMLTKEIKALNDYLEEIEKAYSRGCTYLGRWYLGEQISRLDIINCQHRIRIAINLRNSL